MVFACVVGEEAEVRDYPTCLMCDGAYVREVQGANHNDCVCEECGFEWWVTEKGQMYYHPHLKVLAMNLCCFEVPEGCLAVFWEKPR